VTGLVVVSLMLTGAADRWSLLWLLVPAAVLVWYVLSPVGRQEFKRS
jgi:cbb3-type cytochrome oxidase subunit 3